jgi:hypothetical protein
MSVGVWRRRPEQTEEAASGMCGDIPREAWVPSA